MDTKYKIIIIVFILIALLYAGHFIIDYMNSNKKKEAFTLFDDDVEHYEEPKQSPKKNIAEENKKSKNETTSEESKYDLRVLILDDIETLQITDKDQKGKLMEIMFNENTLKKVSTLSDKERLKFVEDKYNSLGVTSSLNEADIKNEDSQLNRSVKNVVSRFKGVEDDSSPVEELPTFSTSKNTSNSELSKELVHRTADTMTKLKTVQNNLETVQKSLNDMQKYVANIDPSSKIDLSSKSGFQMPKIPELPGSSSIIEGFENIRGFAPAF